MSEVQADPAATSQAYDDSSAALERLQLFSAVLTRRRNEAIQARAASGTERRWLDDLDSYQGRDANTRRVDLMDTVSGTQVAQRRTANDTTTGKRSTVFVQLTRQKTNACAARAADMLFPTDDKNWGIKPTPVPELMDALKVGQNQPYTDPQTGQPLPHPNPDPQTPNADGSMPPPGAGQLVTMADLASEQMQIAQQKATAMEREIDDQLTECSYNGEGRKVLQDAAKLGSGVLKGPSVINRINKKWVKQTNPANPSQSVQMLQMIQEIRPQSYRVDPWNFYPDPTCGDDHQNGAYVFEREFMPGRVLAKMAKVPGYNWQAISMCLAEGPQHVHSSGTYTDNVRAGDLSYNQGNYQDKRFELWTYTGDIDRDDLETIGLTPPDNTESWLVTFSAVIVMCNNRIIKAMLNPLDTGDFPYDVFHWERVDLSPFGVGVPYLMRYAQRTLNAAWRAMLDNMALSSGPQIIMNRKSVTPADGNWELTARKLWFMQGDSDDVQKAFYVFEVNSHQPEIEAVINLAMKFADEETSLPQIAQGEQGTAPDTVGGMSILMNSANTVLRRIVKQYDDEVTRPHIRRYYDWNMQYNEDEEIKGDFEVDARGSSVLIVRDQMAQGLVQVANLAKDPDYAVFVDKQKLFRKIVEAQHVTPDDVMNTPEQIEANLKAQSQAAPPPDPRIQAAQISTQSNQQIATATLQSNERIATLKIQGEEQYVQTQKAMADDKNAALISQLQMQRELAILQYANANHMQLTDIKAQLVQLAMQQGHQSLEASANRMTRPAGAPPNPSDGTQPAQQPDEVM